MNSNKSNKDIYEIVTFIKDRMVTKDEFETRMTKVEGTLSAVGNS